MKKQKWIVGPAVVALALGTSGIIMAQTTTGGDTTPDAGRQGKANRAGKADRATKQDRAARRAARAERGAGRARTVTLTPQMLEKVLGKPLTGEQRKAVDDAAQTYMDSVARAVGLTPDELRARTTEYRQAQRNARKATATDGAAAAPGED